MSTDTPTSEGPEPADLQAELETLREDVADLQAAVEADEGDGKMSIVATKGTLDMAYPPLILATTAAAFGWDVTVFHTFWGLDVLHEEKAEDLKLSAVGNPSMPMPNALAALPGMDALATWMMERRIDEEGVATVEELLDVAVESGVELQACQMTMDLMGYEAEELFDEVEAGVGAATALEDMADADVQLLV
jgi:peroxiredoxin family protein